MPAGRPRRLASLATIAAIALAAAACNPFAATAGGLRREGTTLIVTAPGIREEDIHGYLCPADPGPGPDRGEEGHQRLLRGGCLDLGVTEAVDPDAEGWSARLNLESLASAQLEAFAGRATYRLVLVAGGDEGGLGFSTDVPAVDLAP